MAKGNTGRSITGSSWTGRTGLLLLTVVTLFSLYASPAEFPVKISRNGPKGTRI